MFKSRFYNKIEDLGESIKKSSTNGLKLQDEINFYKNLPEVLVDYFPRLIETGVDSYTLEKIKTKTVSDVYLYEADGTDDMLAAAFKFLKIRPSKEETSEKSTYFLFTQKVKIRYNLLHESGLYRQMCDHLIYGRFVHKYEELLTRYFQLVEKFLLPCDNVVYHHGDFCLTNMFFKNNSLKLIDPMGYEEEFKNMHDPLYDLAKLSHSILGNYDRIINDDFDIIVKEKDFPFGLQIHGRNAYEKNIFKMYLNEHGYNYRQVRLREVSLFLSMLPLHPESMRRISAFILQAEEIITELEKKRGNL